MCNPAEYVKNPVFAIKANFIHAYELAELCTERLLDWKAKVPLRETLLHTMTHFHDLYGKKDWHVERTEVPTQLPRSSE